MVYLFNGSSRPVKRDNIKRDNICLLCKPLRGVAGCWLLLATPYSYGRSIGSPYIAP